MKRINRPRRKTLVQHYAHLCRVELSAQPSGRHGRKRAIQRAGTPAHLRGTQPAPLRPPRPGPVYRLQMRQTKGPAHYRAQAATR